MDIVLYCMHEGTNETYCEDLFDIRGKWRGRTEWKMDIIRGRKRRKEGKKEEDEAEACVCCHTASRTFFCENPATKQFVSSTQPVIRQIGNKINNVA